LLSLGDHLNTVDPALPTLTFQTAIPLDAAALLAADSPSAASLYHTAIAKGRTPSTFREHKTTSKHKSHQVNPLLQVAADNVRHRILR
jgi:hypothetical protein